MKNSIQCSLLGDGAFDKALLPILKWAINDVAPDLIVEEFDFVDLRLIDLHNKKLHTKIKAAIEFCKCDILFIHRDAERTPLSNRLMEIQREWELAKTEQVYVPVVPVHMTEAWLLLEEVAIRKAAGNRNGLIPLSLPNLKNLEKLPNPKDDLYKLLEMANNPTKRRRPSSTDLARMAHLVAEYIEDFSSLRQLPSFQNFEIALVNTLKRNGFL